MYSRNILYFERLDSLRFIAATMVLMFHATVPQMASLDHHSLLVWIREGHRGVNLFFALSGFLFAMIASKGQQIDYKNFIYNRFLRIFPLLLFVFLITAALHRDDWHSDKVLGVLFMQLYLTEFQSITSLGTSWTISTEFVFYLLFPFLHTFANKYGERYLIALISLFITMRFLCLPLLKNELVYFFSLLGRFDVLLMGMLMGRFYVKKPQCCTHYWVLPLVLLGITAYLLLLSRMPHYPAYLVLYPPIEAMLWSLLIIAVLNSQLKLSMLVRWTAKLGSVSYSMYLLHPFIILQCQSIQLLENALWNAVAVGFGLILPLTIGLSFLSFYVIEKPFLDFRVRYFKD